MSAWLLRRGTLPVWQLKVQRSADRWPILPRPILLLPNHTSRSNRNARYITPILQTRIGRPGQRDYQASAWPSLRQSIPGTYQTRIIPCPFCGPFAPCAVPAWRILAFLDNGKALRAARSRANPIVASAYDSLASWRRFISSEALRTEGNLPLHPAPNVLVRAQRSMTSAVISSPALARA